MLTIRFDRLGVQPGDLVLWNNRTLQHAREPFDNSQPRTLRRTALMARAA